MAGVSDRVPLHDEVRRLQDAFLAHGAAQRTQQATARFVAARGRGRLRLVASLTVMAAAAAALVFYLAWPSPIGFVMADVRGAVGTTLRAPAGGALPLRFSDGSQVALAAGARARVEATSRRHVDMRLEGGRADVHVNPGQGVAWRFAAGPFEVRVTGTRFALDWAPDDKRFSLRLSKGSVEVTGPLLPAPVRLRGGRDLRVDLGAGTVEDVPLTGPVTVTAEPRPARRGPTSLHKPRARAVDRGERVAAATIPTPAAADWQALAAAHRYADAMAVIEATGLSTLCGRLAARDLLAVADIARAANRGTEARAAYRCLRTRFAGSNDAALAAYMLGRLAFEIAADDGEAITWFGRYLEERPQGELAEAALGRLMEAQSRAGAETAARASARRYLERFAEGPHAQLATHLLGADAR